MAINPKYIFKIEDIYNLTDDDENEITTDSGKNLKWKDGYTNFKSNIRKHLKLKQNNRCAFCRCRVSIGTNYSNLEHIVSKTDYPQFKCLPKNLVYCCVKCNLAKVKKNTLSSISENKNEQVFPNNSDGFILVNPYYDDYQDHFDFIDDLIITVINDSAKGKETIGLYSLARPELAEERAYELKIDSTTANEKLLSMLTLPDLSDETKEQINNVINELPYWVIED